MRHLSSAPKQIRVLLVDDHDLILVGLRVLLRRAGGIQVVGEAKTMASAVTESARLRPDVVLMDILLPDGSGIEACRRIRTVDSQTRVLFLTQVEDDDTVLSTIAAGADGYLLKDGDKEELIRAIGTVAGGQSILDPSVTQRVLARMRARTTSPNKNPIEALSAQEQRILKLVADGRTNKEIAMVFQLSDKTVRNYLTNVFQKLHVSRRSQAAVVYVQHMTPEGHLSLFKRRTKSLNR